MRVTTTEGGIVIEATQEETTEWATRPGMAWPCSRLRDDGIAVELESNGDLVDVRVTADDELDRDYEGPADELGAWIDDALAATAATLMAARRTPTEGVT